MIIKTVTAHIGKAGARPWDTSGFLTHVRAARLGQPARYDPQSQMEGAWKRDEKTASHPIPA